jgi:hypothetical protein
MKQVTKIFYSRSNASKYNEKVQGSSSYDSNTGKTTVTHYEDKK